MAGEIQANYTTGKTLDAIIRNSNGLVWQTTTSTFVTYATANRANYLITVTEQGTASQTYVGTFPTGIGAGVYAVTVYVRATSGTAAESDLIIAAGNIEWTGLSVYTDTNFILHEGLCQSGSTTLTIKLATSASSTDNMYNYATVTIVAGTGAGQTRQILGSPGYVGSTRVATVDTIWTVTPDTTSQARLLGRII